MRVFIQNRKSQKISVLVEKQDNQRGLVLVMHGLGGFKEQPHIQAFADSFKEEGFTVIRFDTTNTLGSRESEGNYEDATVTNYFADLEDVIKWARSKEWYEEPFILAGHSLGGLCTSLYAIKYPQEVKALAPLAASLGGKYSFDNKPKEEIKKWEKEGFSLRKSTSRPGLVRKLKWAYMIDLRKYDLIKDVNKLTMPILLIVGEDDKRHVSDQELFFKKLQGKKELHIIKGANHDYKGKLNEVKKIMKNWIEKLK